MNSKSLDLQNDLVSHRIQQSLMNCTMSARLKSLNDWLPHFLTLGIVPSQSGNISSRAGQDELIFIANVASGVIITSCALAHSVVLLCLLRTLHREASLIKLDV